MAISIGIATLVVLSGTRTWWPFFQRPAREIPEEVEYEESEDGSEKADAEQFLRDLLSDEPVPSKQVKADADGAGCSRATIRCAQKSIGVETLKGSMEDAGGGHFLA